MDHEAIKRAINEEPTSPGDARIARFSFDAGPGNAFSIYNLKGISGAYRLVNKSGKVSLVARHEEPERGDGYSCLLDLTGFSGELDFESGTTRATLSATPVNPAATTEFDLPDGGIKLSGLRDTVIAVSAMSADGTASSSFEIVFDKSLVTNPAPTEEAPPTKATARRAEGARLSR